MSFSFALVLRITKDFSFLQRFQKYEIDEIKNEKNKQSLIEKKPAWTYKTLKCAVTKVISKQNLFYDYDRDEEKIIRFVSITELKEISGWI
jgi:hypothetical protein